MQRRRRMAALPQPDLRAPGQVTPLTCLIWALRRACLLPRNIWLQNLQLETAPSSLNRSFNL